MPETLLTPAEAADWLRVQPQTLRDWVRKGFLECVTLPGGHHRYAESDIQAIVDASDAGRSAG